MTARNRMEHVRLGVFRRVNVNGNRDMFNGSEIRQEP